MARILIIEDDPQSARLATRVLEREGHEVTLRPRVFTMSEERHDPRL